MSGGFYFTELCTMIVDKRKKKRDLSIYVTGPRSSAGEVCARDGGKVQSDCSSREEQLSILGKGERGGLLIQIQMHSLAFNCLFFEDTWRRFVCCMMRAQRFKAWN